MTGLCNSAVFSGPDGWVQATLASPNLIAVTGSWQAAVRARKAKQSLGHPIAGGFAIGATSLDAQMQIARGLLDTAHTNRIGKSPKVYISSQSPL